MDEQQHKRWMGIAGLLVGLPTAGRQEAPGQYWG